MGCYLLIHLILFELFEENSKLKITYKTFDITLLDLREKAAQEIGIRAGIFLPGDLYSAIFEKVFSSITKICNLIRLRT
ncbi:hypothetical protein DHD80_05785 [Gramella sp. AN32]|nr:hypothetical protein [Gramella sp. AN32]